MELLFCAFSWNAQDFRAVHNLAHQGIESPAMFHNLGIPESHYGMMEWVAADGYISMNLLKGGLVTADRIVTVSCMHAFDMMTPKGAMGLHPLLQCRQNVMNGIINGIDTEEWNPETDAYITERYCQKTDRSNAGRFRVGIPMQIYRAKQNANSASSENLDFGRVQRRP